MRKKSVMQNKAYLSVRNNIAKNSSGPTSMISAMQAQGYQYPGVKFPSQPEDYIMNIRTTDDMLKDIIERL